MMMKILNACDKFNTLERCLRRDYSKDTGKKPDALGLGFSEKKIQIESLNK